MLKPAGLMLDEKGSNLNAIKYAFGSKFMKRCISSDFHFKQSENQKMKDSNMFKRNMLEAYTETQFKTAVTNYESFIIDKTTKFLKRKVEMMVSSELTYISCLKIVSFPSLTFLNLLIFLG